MIKYFCDGCNKEVMPSKLNPKEIATIEFVNPITQAQTTRMFCGDCTVKLKNLFDEIQKENKMTTISNRLSFKTK